MAELIQCPLCWHEQIEGVTQRCKKCGIALAATVTAGSPDIGRSSESAPRPAGPSGLEEFIGPRPESTPNPGRSSWPLPNGFQLHGQPSEDRSLPGVDVAKVLWHAGGEGTRQCIASWFPRVLDLSVYERLDSRTKRTSIDEIASPVHVGRLENSHFRTVLIEPDLSATSLRVWLHQKSRAANNGEFARAVLTSLASAISCLHEERLWHLNLRPDVIEVYVADGPIRARLGGFSRLMSASGIGLSHNEYYRHAYIAPELDYGEPGQYSDFWSLGVVLFELMTGRHPFGHDGHLLQDAGVNKWLAERNRIDYSAVPGEWERLLRGLLTHDVQRRWGLQEINAFLRREPLTAPPAEYKTSLPPFKLAPGDREEARTPGDLAHLIATRWRQARSLASATRISGWLREDSNHEGESADVAAIEGARRIPLDLKLLEIINVLAPEQAPTYMGHALRKVSDLHALAIGAISETASADSGEMMPPTEVISSLFEDEVIRRLPKGIAGANDLVEADSRWRDQVAEYQSLSKEAGGVANELAPPPDDVRTLAFLLASVIDDAFLNRSRRQIEVFEEALETPWYRSLRDDSSEMSPARVWLLQSVVGQATREAESNREARLVREAQARRLLIAGRRERRADAVRRILNVSAALPGAVIGAGLGMVAFFILAILLWIPTALVAWIASIFMQSDMSTIADQLASIAFYLTMLVFVLAGAAIAYMTVESSDNILTRVLTLSLLTIIAGAVCHIGGVNKDSVVEWFGALFRGPVWNEAHDCGKSTYVVLAAGEGRCSFQFDANGALSFKNKRIQPSLIIPVGSSAALRPQKISVHLETSPDGRFVMIDAFHDSNVARYLLDTTTDKLHVVIRDATVVGKFVWSSSSESIANFTRRGGRVWVELLRFADGQTARAALPENEQATNFAWADPAAFVISTCAPARVGNPRECRQMRVSFPARASSTSSAADRRVLPPASLNVGVKVKVNANEVNVRRGPGRTSPVIGRVNSGFIGKVRSASVDVDSIRWYRIVFDNGLDGWIAGRYLVAE